MNRLISRIRNGLQLDGRLVDGITTYLQNLAGTILLATDSSGNYYGKIKSPNLATATATDDGLTTGLIGDNAEFVTITSAGATKAVTLPAASAAYIGRVIKLYVGANGYELLTPASSGNTINTVDSDGTNQLDVAANTLLVCTQITATGWAAFQIAATTITVVAPDND